MIRFRAPSTPLLWFDGNEDLSLEKDGEAVHLKDTSGSIGMALFHLPFFLVGFAVITGALLFSAYGAFASVLNDSVCDPMFEQEVKLGLNDTIYCESKDSGGSMRVSIQSVEVAEQHFKYTIAYDQDEPTIDEFRWSEDNGILAIGMVDYYEEEDATYYSCNLYKLESTLGQNWTYQELIVSDYWYAMPSWCRDGASSSENLTYVSAEGPLFEGEYLYYMHEGDFGEISMERYTLTSLEYRYVYVPYTAGAIEIILPAIFGIIFGSIFLSVGDARKMNIRLNPSAQTICVRKTFGGTRLSGWTWKNIDFNSIKMVRYEKTVHHQSGGGEDGPIRRWKTYHKGIEVSFSGGSKPVDVLFLEHGNEFDIFDSTLKNLCDSLGVKMPEIKDNIWSKMPSIDNYKSVKLQDFEVHEWDSQNDAQLLVGWYNSLSSQTPPLKFEDVMDATEIDMFDSQQDAQKFLDYLVSLLDKEMGSDTDEIPTKDTDSNVKNVQADHSSEQDGAPQTETPGAFWNEV